LVENFLKISTPQSLSFWGAFIFVSGYASVKGLYIFFSVSPWWFATQRSGSLARSFTIGTRRGALAGLTCLAMCKSHQFLLVFGIFLLHDCDNQIPSGRSPRSATWLWTRCPHTVSYLRSPSSQISRSAGSAPARVCGCLRTASHVC
jgi:hypothetical protein